MPRGRVHSRAVRTRARDVAHLGQCIQVEDANMPGRAGARHIQIAAVGIGGHVVESTVAADELNLLHLVGAVGLCAGQDGNYENCRNGNNLA